MQLLRGRIHGGGERWIAPPGPKKRREEKKEVKEEEKEREEKGEEKENGKNISIFVYLFIPHSCLHGWIHLGEGRYFRISL
jgi:hypothetical protein